MLEILTGEATLTVIEHTSARTSGLPPKISMMRLGFATLGCPGATPGEVLALAARHDLTMAEIRCSDEEFLSPRTSLDEARSVGRLLAGRLTTLTLSSYVRLCADDTATDLGDALRIANALGARAVRVFMKDGSTAAPGRLSVGEARAMERLARVAGEASDLSVRVLIETHDSHPTAGSLRRFLDAVEHHLPSLPVGVLWDTAHSWAAGEPFGATLDGLGDRLDYVQVKDVRSCAEPTPVPLGSGTFPITELVMDLRRNGYDGTVCLEWERRWHPELPELDTALEVLPHWLGTDG